MPKHIEAIPQMDTVGRHFPRKRERERGLGSIDCLLNVLDCTLKVCHESGFNNGPGMIHNFLFHSLFPPRSIAN